MLFLPTVLHGLLSLKSVNRPVANIASGSKQNQTCWILSYSVHHCWVTDSKSFHNCCTQTIPSVTRYFSCTPRAAGLQTLPAAASRSCACTLGNLLTRPHELSLAELQMVPSLVHTAPVEGWFLTQENPLCVGPYLKWTSYYILY